ncbi:MAG: glycosyltransferase family 2 protein [Actinomycetota bacterium]|nr:glycosyltransferase family 2 protein [Actinomycetota bacterium]
MLDDEAPRNGAGRNGAGRNGGVPLRVVVVHWNQVAACLDTVARFTDREVPVRVTVVDNGSEPAALAELRTGLAGLEHSDSVTLIEVGENAGFGPGANVGLRSFLDDPDDGTWVALSPHDVDPFPGTLAAMLDAAEGEPMAGLMCADVGDGMTPVIDPYFGGMVVEAAAPAPPDGTARWDEAAYPHGTLMLLRRECIDEVGVFDERFFSYCEEADLALRARRAGWRVGLIRGARVQNIHIGSGMAIVDYLQTRNTLLLVQEMSGWYHAFIRACITLIQTYRGVRRPETRAMIFDAPARLAGLRDFVLRRFGPPPASLMVPPSQFDHELHARR